MVRPDGVGERVTRENCVISNSSVRVESVCTLCARSATYVRTMPTMLPTMPLILTLRHAAPPLEPGRNDVLLAQAGPSSCLLPPGPNIIN